jgi:hypothetical protein
MLHAVAAVSDPLRAPDFGWPSHVLEKGSAPDDLTFSETST